MLPHISVCICTFKRPLGLRRLLECLLTQETSEEFTYSAVIVDNDALRSAQAVVDEFREMGRLPITYWVEPNQNISLARNRAVAVATGEYIALIDDDEYPTGQWLVTLLRSCRALCADGVLGPVVAEFEETPPAWIIKGGFYMRPNPESGAVLQWRDCRTGNALLRRYLIAEQEEAPFRQDLRGGEDRDFFRRKIEEGYRFVWCREAPVYEVLPRLRWRRRFMIRRALLRGAVALVSNGMGPIEISKSVIAIVAYLLALPFALMLGHHRFMRILISLFDHLGKLLALVGMNPVREPYVTE